MLFEARSQRLERSVRIFKFFPEQLGVKNVKKLVLGALDTVFQKLAERLCRAELLFKALGSHPQFLTG